ncbi:MAG: NADH-quinone oxidoreductase subunit D [Actinobacteria bacterium]|nr:NADH-quinone oxidoreductase subunit D [Actinomycetota bacterium]
MPTEQTWMLTLGPSHPAGHGPIALNLRTSGDGASDDTIEWCEPLIHPLHRGAEKLFESRDYRQILALADRHDWLSAFGSELGLALTLETMLGIQVPPRATWIRTAMAELNRAIHHLRWLGETIGELAATSSDSGLRDKCRNAREQLTDLHEANSGGRVHPMLVQPGGVRVDLPPRWSAAVIDLTTSLTPLCDELMAWVDSADQLAGVAPVSGADAIAYGVSGPVARASGLPLDLRFDDPYVAYPELIDVGVLSRCVSYAGDAKARLQVLAAELPVSLECLRFSAEQLAGPHAQGAISVRLPRSVRVPEGDGYGWTENPTGINGWYLISKGGPMPYRLKLRTASFANAAALSEAVVGRRVADLPVALMSFLLVAGDLAK